MFWDIELRLMSLTQQMTHHCITFWLTYWKELSLCCQHADEDRICFGEPQDPPMAEEVAAAHSSTQQPVSRQKNKRLILRDGNRLKEVIRHYIKNNTAKLVEDFSLWLMWISITPEQIEDLFNYADAGKNWLTPDKQTAESPAGRKVKQWGN